MRRAWLVGLLAAGFAWTHAAAAGKAYVYALVGARVVPVAGPVLESGTVVLRDGVIEAVSAAAAIPPDARVIDAKGLTLTPGFIDAFGDVGLPSAPARRAGEPGGNAPSGPPPADPLAAQALAIDKVRAPEALKARDAGVTTVLSVPRDGLLPGRSVLLNLSGDDAQAMALEQPAAQHVHLNPLARRYPGSLMGVVAYVRQALYDAARYREARADYEKSPAGKKRPRYDAALEAWQDVLSGRLPLVVTASRENDVRRALALQDEFKLRVIVAGAPQAWRVAELVKARKLPLLVSVNFDPPRAPAFGLFGGPDEEREKREIDEARRNPVRLHEAGVPFALVSGYAKDFVGGVRKAIDEGLPREAALRAVTLGAAEVLGVADRLGSLEPGKIANVVAWQGEPLTQPAKAKLVFVDGALYEPEEKPGRENDKDKDAPEGKPGEEETR